MSTNLPGLSAFSVASRVEWLSWKDWRHLSLCSDQGSDMVSLMHCLEYFPKLQLNVTSYWDIEHGTNRNLWGAIDCAKLKPMMCLVMLAANLPSMPDETDLRYRQARDRMEDHFTLTSPECSPMFQYLSLPMHRERSSELLVEEGESNDAALWRLLRHDSMFKKKPGKCCQARFNSIVHGGREMLRTWSCRQFELAICSIEANMLANKNIYPKSPSRPLAQTQLAQEKQRLLQKR